MTSRQIAKNLLDLDFNAQIEAELNSFRPDRKIGLRGDSGPSRNSVRNKEREVEKLLALFDTDEDNSSLQMP